MKREKHNRSLQPNAEEPHWLSSVFGIKWRDIMKPNIVFGLINIGCALLFIGISIPLVMRKIKMNPLYGIRIEKSFQSEDNWYNINAYGGKELIIWSIPILLAGLISFAFALPFFLMIGIIPLCILIALIRILAYANNF